MKFISVVFLSGLVFSGSSFATLLDFNATSLGVSSSTAYNSVSLSEDGIAVDVTAYTIENNGLGVINSLSSLSTAGLGVYVSGSNNLGVKSALSGDGSKMDGGSDQSDLDEGLLFTFDQVVSLDYINFDNFGSGDDFNLTVDGVTLVVDFSGSDASLYASQVSGQFDEYNFSGVTGTEFLFWVDSNSDSFKIDRMEVSAVPEPSILALFGLGLIGLGFGSRKRQA